MHFVNAKGILSKGNGINIYRGCTHGCIYCDSRSKCYQMNHDFEDIEVKINAPELLKSALKSKRIKCMIGTGSMSDPYIHLEEELLLTRRCLEIINKYECGVVIQTKSSRILRDLDLLKKINEKSKVVVQMTLTTYDDKLCRVLEPNVSTTKERFEVLKILNENNIKTIVWLDPFLPYINDTVDNLNGLLDYCIKANVYGIIFFGFGLTLREGNREYYYLKLDEHFPGLKNKYIKRYGYSYEITSDNSKVLFDVLKRRCKENNIIIDNNVLFKYMREYPSEFKQMSLF